MSAATTSLLVPDPNIVRVVHRIPGRVRLRSHAGRWSSHQLERLANALQRTTGVQSYRISACGHSVAVHHTAPVHAVVSSVQMAVAQPRAAAPAHARGATPKRTPPARGRGAGRRLLACAVLTLALALLPEPLAPAMVVLRLLATAITAAVRHQAEAHAEPCWLTRWLEAFAFVISVGRAEHVVRAFFVALLKHFAEARLRQALA